MRKSIRPVLQKASSVALVLAGLGLAVVSAESGASVPRAALQPEGAPPGATVSLTGTGFGRFTSVQVNTVTFNGIPALVQRWEPDLIEVKVPFHAKTGPVEIGIGKKKLAAGTFTVVRPHIESVTPAEAERGMRLHIVGRHFGPTAGSRDPNTMFGVNDVMIGGVLTRPRQWKDDRIEVEIPGNAVSGDVVVRLASSDPLPDGSCCVPVDYVVSNAVPLSLIPTVRVDPLSGPVGTKVVLFGQGFGAGKSASDAVLIAGQPTTVAQWKDDIIVVHVPLGAESGPMVLKSRGGQRTVGQFTVHPPKATAITPASAPIGSLLRINGEHFGSYAESGSTPFNFLDFNTGQNRVEIGGVPAVIYRWQDDRIEVWVPFSAKSGTVTVFRSANRPNPDGSCCAERSYVTTEAGHFTVTVPTVESYSPKEAGLDEIITIKGSGFGTFLKTAEQTQPGLNEKGHDFMPYEFSENIARTEVLLSNVGVVVVSWMDTEIKVRVPRRHLYGIGKKGEFNPDLSSGPLVVRRGSWDVLPNGTCCTPKRWTTVEAGPFTIAARGLPDTTYWNNPSEPSANQ